MPRGLRPRPPRPRVHQPAHPQLSRLRPHHQKDRGRSRETWGMQSNTGVRDRVGSSARPPQFGYVLRDGLQFWGELLLVSVFGLARVARLPAGRVRAGIRGCSRTRCTSSECRRGAVACGQEGIDECVERFRAALRRELKKPELVLVKSGAQPHPQVRSDRAGPDKSGHRRGATSQRVRAPPQAPAPSGLRCGDPLAEGLQPSRARDGDDVGRGPCRHRRQSSRGDNPEVRCLSGPY